MRAQFTVIEDVFSIVRNEDPGRPWPAGGSQEAGVRQINRASRRDIVHSHGPLGGRFSTRKRHGGSAALSNRARHTAPATDTNGVDLSSGGICEAGGHFTGGMRQMFSSRVIAGVGAIGLISLSLGAGIPQASDSWRSGHQRSPASQYLHGPGMANHPVGVVPSHNIQVPEGWPVDVGGSITCGTCHYAFPSLGASDPLLRGSNGGLIEPTRFCARCHTSTSPGEASGMHWLAVGAAHIKSNGEYPGRYSGGVDPASKGCLACHDGVNATETSSGAAAHSSFASFANERRNHPIGIPYPTGQRRGNGTEYRPASFLPREIRLPDGMVSCVSCHNLYAREEHLLAVPIKDSALCLTCHDMK